MVSKKLLLSVISSYQLQSVRSERMRKEIAKLQE